MDELTPSKQPIQMTVTKLSDESPVAQQSAVPDSKVHISPNLPFNVQNIKAPVINFRALSGFEEKEKKFKIDLKKKLIIESISNVLSIYSNEEKKYNTGIVLFVCQCVEDLLVTPKSGAQKADIVKEICADFFDSSPELVAVVIDLVFTKIIKSTVFRRNYFRAQKILYEVSKNLFGTMVDSMLSTAVVNIWSKL
jgi:hypothetical protein